MNETSATQSSPSVSSEAITPFEPSDPNAAPPTEVHSATGAVTLEDVRHVAALASLELSPEEIPGMQRDLNAILQHVAALNLLDTTGIPAMAQVGQLLQQQPADAGQDLRTDQVRASVDRSAVLQEAPETDGRFFKVPKVIER